MPQLTLAKVWGFPDPLTPPAKD